MEEVGEKGNGVHDGAGSRWRTRPSIRELGVSGVMKPRWGAAEFTELTPETQGANANAAGAAAGASCEPRSSPRAESGSRGRGSFQRGGPDRGPGHRGKTLVPLWRTSPLARESGARFTQRPGGRSVLWAGASAAGCLPSSAFAATPGIAPWLCRDLPCDLGRVA